MLGEGAEAVGDVVEGTVGRSVPVHTAAQRLWEQRLLRAVAKEALRHHLAWIHTDLKPEFKSELQLWVWPQGPCLFCGNMRATP